MEGFIEITDRYRKKHYPKGYFVMLVKRAGGMKDIILGALSILMVGDVGINRLSAVLGGELTGDEKYKEVITLGFVFTLLLAMGVLLLRMGIKNTWKGRDRLIQRCAEISGYPESTMEEFEEQLMRSDAIAFRTVPSGTINILTADYLMWGISTPNLVKISDIMGAFLVSLPDAFSKKKHFLYIAICCKNKNVILLAAKQDRAEYLTSLLLAKNPNIETADGAVLTNEKYEAIVSEMEMRIRL